MARKKKINVKKDKKDSCEKIEDAEKGDFCYYLDASNKVGWAEIHSVFEEKDILCFSIICQKEYKFYALPCYYCSFDEKFLKGKKRILLHDANKKQ